MVIEDEGEPKAELEIFQSGNGWGYQIIMKQKILIYQPTIPAIDTAIPFPDEVNKHLQVRVISSIFAKNLILGT